MIFELIVALTPFIIPYTLLGENLGALILTIVSSLYIMLNFKKLTLNKKIFFPICAFIVVIIFTNTILLKNSIEGFSGMFIYINMLLYAICFFNFTLDREKLYYYISATLVVICIVSIVIHGLYFDVRIYGNIGYANSYALLLLIGIYLNKIRILDKFTLPFEIIFVLGILFTGSRTTLVLLGVFYIFEIIKNKKITIIESFIWAFIQYVIYSKMLLLSLVVTPIIVGLFYFIHSIKNKNIIYYFCGVMCVALALFDSSNTLLRLKNISLSNGSLQERFIYFEDAIKSILNNPLGHGINTFQYNQAIDSSAFYDVKYIHNSLLQIAYDCGLFTTLLFIILILFLAFYICKNCTLNKSLWISLYVSILIHSLLDFDLSYSSFLIILVFIPLYSTSSNDSINYKYKYNYIILFFTSLLLIPTLYLTTFESLITLGGRTNYIKLNTIANTISFNNDTRQLYNLSLQLKELYDESNDSELLNAMENTLIHALNVSSKDSRLLWNLNYVYYKKQNLTLMDSISDNLCNAYKFKPNFYEVQASYYKDLYARGFYDSTEYCKKINELEELYSKSTLILNTRCKFITNQIKN